MCGERRVLHGAVGGCAALAETSAEARHAIDSMRFLPFA
jgi:hypothetical protein